MSLAAHGSAWHCMACDGTAHGLGLRGPDSRRANSKARKRKIAGASKRPIVPGTPPGEIGDTSLQGRLFIGVHGAAFNTWE